MITRAVRERDVNPVAGVLQPIDCQTKAHANLEFAHPRLHDAMQDGSHDPAGGRQTLLDHRFL